jgi:hypothetical protein
MSAMLAHCWRRSIDCSQGISFTASDRYPSFSDVQRRATATPVHFAASVHAPAATDKMRNWDAYNAAMASASIKKSGP